MAGREPEGFETETEVTPELLEAFEQEQPSGETENEAEYWRRYRAWRRNRFRRGGRRRWSFLRRRSGGFGGRFGGASGGSFGGGSGGSFGGGFGAMPSDDSDSGDSGDDDDGQGEVRRYASARYRYPAYRYAAASRPAYRYGYGRTAWGQRYPYQSRHASWNRYAGRGYYGGGRYWPYRTGYGVSRYAPSTYAYRRWPWLYRGYGGYRTPLYSTAAVAGPPAVPAGGGGPAGSPWILLVQSCLNRLLGPGATPSNGVLGHATRRALRAFQRRNGLPPSGSLDTTTVQALQSACMGGAVATPSEPPPAAPPEPPPAPAGPPPDDSAAAPAEPAPPEPAPAPEPPADAAAPPPDAAAPADGGGDAPPPEGEITIGRHEGESEQEFLVDGAMQVAVERHDPVPLERDPQFAFLPDAPGLYVIYVNNAPWYVGIAEGSIRHRFQQRRKVLSDLQIPASALANRSVGWLLLRYSSAPKGAIQRRAQNTPAAVFRPLSGKYAALRILEQVYIKRLRNPGGNKTTEAVQFGPRGSLVVTENGATVSQYQPGNRV